MYSVYSTFPVLLCINHISNRSLRDTLYTCDGSSAILYFPLLFKIGNGNITIQDFSFTPVKVILPYSTGCPHTQGADYLTQGRLHSHTRYLFQIGYGSVAMQVHLIFKTDGGLFAMHSDYVLKI